MVDSDFIHQDFLRRLRDIPAQGMGLSVDVYSPDLLELVNRLRERGLQPGYLEIFKATTTALTKVRQELSDIPLAYHGEGLWITQPDVQASPFFQQDLGEMVLQLKSLQSLWLNHECAIKQMAGYSFGTYLPPLYTSLSARVVAGNIAMVQQTMDRQSARTDGTAPLFLLELPPLTYFAAGTIPIPDYFRLVTASVPCGLVLDIGHLWTVYRYTAVCRRISLERFVAEFLAEFPLERVVEIHVAGLAYHELAVEPREGQGLPEWIDAHAAPIPLILFTMLEQVLAHPNLVSLRAVALEVDTKSIEMIVEEYATAVGRFSLLVQQAMARDTSVGQWKETMLYPASVQEPVRQSDRQQLCDDYERYAQIISGQAPITGPEWQEVVMEGSGLIRYRTSYAPHEILRWGGDLEGMFPQACQALADRGVCLSEFVDFWFRSPRPVTHSYDFFLLKIERFFEFVTERAPDLGITLQQECDLLRLAYAQVNEGGESITEMEQPR
ncbi:MAG: multinuclear nonheme iron-dependent oxidase [Nitrospiraceae bacterium]